MSAVFWPAVLNQEMNPRPADLFLPGTLPWLYHHRIGFPRNGAHCGQDGHKGKLIGRFRGNFHVFQKAAGRIDGIDPDRAPPVDLDDYVQMKVKTPSSGEIWFVIVR